MVFSKLPSKVQLIIGPKLFLGCLNGPKTEILYHQKPLALMQDWVSAEEFILKSNKCYVVPILLNVKNVKYLLQFAKPFLQPNTHKLQKFSFVITLKSLIDEQTGINKQGCVGKECQTFVFKSLLTIPSNVYLITPQANFPTNNLNFHIFFPPPSQFFM